jgi:hypothetical protein
VLETTVKAAQAGKIAKGKIEGVSYLRLVFQDCLQVLIQQAKIADRTNFCDYYRKANTDG